MSDQEPPVHQQPQDESATMQRISRRSFAWASVAVAAAYGGYRWIDSRPVVDGLGKLVPKPTDGSDPTGIGQPFRDVLEFNEEVWSRLYSPDRLAPTFSKSQVTDERVNGDLGLADDFDPDQWKLQVVGVHGRTKPLELTIGQIKSLPSMEMTTQFCCIEGWNLIQTFKGVAMREFMRRYPPMTSSGQPPDYVNRLKDVYPYIKMETPPSEGTDPYYVSLDLASAMHAQTMLCYEMNGKPLTLDHGAPLRLAIPTKYGVKNIKRIGAITYSKSRPPDYWADQGYDWYDGL